MEEISLGRKILYSTTLAGLIATSLPNCNCGSSEKRCESPDYQAIQGLNLTLEKQEQYLSASCPSGCSYDKEVGCCYCPE